MKVICDRAALLDAATVVGSVTGGRTPSPVLRCMKLAASDGLLQLAATDLEMGLRIAVPQVEVQEDGEAVVPADKLLQIVRTCDDSTLTLVSDGHALNIEGAGSHFKVYGFDPKEFPPVRDFSEATVDCQLKSRDLQTLVTRTAFAAATEHSRYAINGLLFERKGKKLRLVATDGRRLAMAQGEVKGGEGDKSCIIPTKAMMLLIKLLRDPDENVRVSIEENQVLFCAGEDAGAAVLSSNLVEGAFPPFEDVIPKDQDKKVSCDTASLLSAIRRAALLTNEESRGVRMAFADDKLTLTSRAPEMGEAEVELALDKYEGDPVEIGFNPGFIADALKVVDGGKVIVELKAPNKPGVLRTGTDFTYVLMPVNLQ
jgi:DNA polymerase-3 subunit beta